MTPPADPRAYQIFCLASLLVYGWWALGFDVGAVQIAVTLAAALGAQYAFGRTAGLPRFDPKSALISGLSLCLLLRTDEPLLAAVGAVLAIGGKFVLRVRGKHVFNPTNFGLMVMVVGSDRVWASSGQWGATGFFAFLMACLGGLVAHRALRSDVSWAFFASYAALLVHRAYGLGDPLAIPLHQLQSGALLLFTFFMISDPKTTPDARLARIAFGILVAVGAFYVQFRLFRPNGLLWALLVLSPLVPFLDRLFAANRYAWPTVPRPEGDAHETTLADPRPVALGCAVR